MLTCLTLNRKYPTSDKSVECLPLLAPSPSYVFWIKAHFLQQVAFVEAHVHSYFRICMKRTISQCAVDIPLKSMARMQIVFASEDFYLIQFDSRVFVEKVLETCFRISNIDSFWKR